MKKWATRPKFWRVRVPDSSTRISGTRIPGGSGGFGLPEPARNPPELFVQKPEPARTENLLPETALVPGTNR